MTLGIKNKYMIFILFLIFLSVLREPLFFLKPRIWAEEGTVYLSNYFYYGLIESIIKQNLGYYSFWSNVIPAFSAKFFDFDTIPYVTTFMSFSIIIITASAPLFLNSQHWGTDNKKMCLSLFILISGSSEIWLNTINSQFYLGLFSVLILLSDLKFGRVYGKLVLVVFSLAVFTGVTTILLLPFFLLRFFQSIHRDRILNMLCSILFMGFVLQFCLFFFNLGSIESTRFSNFSLSNFPRGFASVFLNLTPEYKYFGTRFMLGFLIVYAFRLLCLKFNTNGILPFVIAIYISIIFTVLSLGMSGGGRYAFIPIVLLFVSVMNFTKIMVLFEKGGVLSLLIFASINFFETDKFYSTDWPSFQLSNVVSGLDGSETIKVFPQWEGKIWEMSLPKTFNN